MAIVSVLAAFTALIGFSFVAQRYEIIFIQLQMSDRLPMPTLAFLSLAKLARQWWWLFGLAAGALEAALIVGRLDRYARAVAVAAGIAILFLAFGWGICLRLPIAEIEHRLRD